MILELFGYDRHGQIRELPTTLQKNALGTLDVSLAAMAFNAPAWISAATMSSIYAVVGSGAPLAIFLSFLFPMLVLALCLVYLTRHAPSAGGIFTFSSRFLHPVAGTVLGWTYTVSCAVITPMTAIIGAQYVQALIPGARGALEAKCISTALVVVFTFVCLRGVTLTARVATVLLACEITVILGLGICGIFSPRVDVPWSAFVQVPPNLTVLGSGVLLGMWMLANFDSAINYIEEARVPVRTVQRALLIVLTSALCVYVIAAVGWQRAVPLEVLAKIGENGDGGPIAAVAHVYLPPSFAWIALFVVITSAIAGLQVSMSAGARTAYRMALDGHLPRVLGRVNRHHAPYLTVLTIAATSILLVWIKPLAQVSFYYNTAVVTLALAYMAALAAFSRVMFDKHPPWRAASASFLPGLAIAVLLYLIYSAGVAPTDRQDLYQAWYIGAAVVASSLLIAYLGRGRQAPMSTEADAGPAL